MSEGARKLPMVDLLGQFREIEEEVLSEIHKVIESSAFINGQAVKDFSLELADHLGAKQVVPCGNGTDALQIALMTLDLKPGDEVIVPAFTYIATVEVIALLQLKPVFVDVDARTFNMDPEALRSAISETTKAIITVHLFGQSADMENILAIADQHGVPVIEDNAQALGAEYTFSKGRKNFTGTMGTIGCTSFFPSKNLGAFGDGGAMIFMDDELAEKARMIANHGQETKYFHEIVGLNSRLDTVQAAILRVKLRHLREYARRRQQVASVYDIKLADIKNIVLPHRQAGSTHVFHQYTLLVKDGKRDQLKAYLHEKGIPSMIYYPLPQHLQNAYLQYGHKKGDFPVSEGLCHEVLSLPIHTQMPEADQTYICEAIKTFFNE